MRRSGVRFPSRARSGGINPTGAGGGDQADPNPLACGEDLSRFRSPATALSSADEVGHSGCLMFGMETFDSGRAAVAGGS